MKAGMLTSCKPRSIETEPTWRLSKSWKKPTMIRNFAARAMTGDSSMKSDEIHGPRVRKNRAPMMDQVVARSQPEEAMVRSREVWPAPAAAPMRTLSAMARPRGTMKAVAAHMSAI